MSVGVLGASMVICVPSMITSTVSLRSMKPYYVSTIPAILVQADI